MKSCQELLTFLFRTSKMHYAETDMQKNYILDNYNFAYLLMKWPEHTAIYTTTSKGVVWEVANKESNWQPCMS